MITLTVEQERLILAAAAAECDVCGGWGKVQRTKRLTRRLRSGKVVRRSQASIKYLPCPGCRQTRRLLDALAGGDR